jgi:hypothetical protein
MKHFKLMSHMLVVVILIILILSACDNIGSSSVDWIVGAWIRTNAYAPHTDVHDLQSSGAYTFYGEYNQATPVSGSTWSSDGVELVLNPVGTFPVTYQVTKINDSQLELTLNGETGYFYRKGAEPNGSIFTSGSTSLSLGTPDNGTLNPGDMKLYSMTLDSNVYVLSWTYSDGLVDVSVYHQDQSTVFTDYDADEPIEELTSSPVKFETTSTETVYIVVEGGAVTESGDFSLNVQFD